MLFISNKNYFKIDDFLFIYLQFESNLGVITVTSMVIALLEFEENNKMVDFRNMDVLLLYAMAVLHELIIQKLNPIELIYSITKIVNKTYKEKDLTAVNCMIYLLANCVTTASVTHVPYLVQLCKNSEDLKGNITILQLF